MQSETVFLVIVVAAWGLTSYYFWFIWRNTKLKSLEESIRLDLKQSIPCSKLQLIKNVVCLDKNASVRELIENMQHPKRMGKREGDPKRGVGSVVIVDHEPQNNMLQSQNIVGIVTLKDIVKGCYEQCYEDKALLDRKCVEIMSQDYMITTEKAVVNDCWQMLLDARKKEVEHILIEKDNQIQGIVTDKDIFKTIEFEPDQG